MEKRIKYSQFQQVKNAAKMIDPLKRKMEPIRKKIEALASEYKNYQTQINALESGIVQIIGFHVDQLVRKVVEPTGKTDAKGKPIMSTKYVPTDMVHYDEHKKEFVIAIPDSTQAPEPSTTESQPESDSDSDIENTESVEEVETEEIENTENNMPWA